MSRTLEQCIRNIFRPDSEFGAMSLSDEDRSIIYDGEVDEMELLFADKVDEMCCIGVQQSVWHKLYMLMQANLSQPISDRVSNVDIITVLSMNDNDPKYLGQLVTLARDCEIANAMLLGFLRSQIHTKGLSELNTMEIDVSSFPDELDDPADPEDTTTLKEIMAIPSARYATLVRLRRENITRRVAQAYPDLNDIVQLRCVDELARHGDYAARIYLDDALPVISKEALSGLYPVDEEHPGSIRQLCILMSHGNPIAREVLLEVTNPSKELLKQLHPMPLTEFDELHLFDLVSDHGCMNAFYYLRSNQKKPLTRQALILLTGHEVSSVVGLVDLYKKGYHVALKLLDEVAGDADDPRRDEAKAALIMLDKKGNIDHGRRGNIGCLSQLFSFPVSKVTWYNRLLFSLFDCGVKNDAVHWLENADVYMGGLYVKEAHELVAECMHVIAESEESQPVGAVVNDIACSFESQLRLNRFNLKSDDSPYDELMHTGYVGISAGYRGNGTEHGHVIKLVFMKINGLIYLAIINRGYHAIATNEVQMFHVQHPEQLKNDDVCKQFSGSDVTMSYLKDVAITGEGIGKDFGLVPLERGSDEEKRDELPLRDEGVIESGEGEVVSSVLAGLDLGAHTAVALGAVESVSPLKMSPQKIGSCALVAAWRDILFRFTHYAMVQDPDIKASRGVLSLDAFEKWLGRAKPVYKRIRSISRIRSAKMAAKILVGDEVDVAGFNVGEVLLFKFIDHMLEKRLANPVDDYGFDKDILQPAFDYLMLQMSESPTLVQGMYMDRIKMAVGDVAFEMMRVEFTATRTSSYSR
ncbi:MAG: hypothetical protein P1U40_07365 [Coxiellaceae bacterium]|nr:hypothetical protein [Coxiellaceae bacterium]